MQQVINSNITGDYWRFIEEWLPNYAQDAQVCLSNDIAAYLEQGSAASDECKANIVACGGKLSDNKQLRELAAKTDALLLREAFKNMLNVSYKLKV
jgi:hypothetical protein